MSSFVTPVTLAESITAAVDTARALADPDIDPNLVVIRAAAGVVAGAAASLAAASQPAQLAEVLLHQPVASHHLEGLLAELRIKGADATVIQCVRDAADRTTAAGFTYAAVQVLAHELSVGDTLIDLGSAVVGRILSIQTAIAGELLFAVAVHDRTTAAQLTLLYDVSSPDDVRVIISAGVGEANDAA